MSAFNVSAQDKRLFDRPTSRFCLWNVDSDGPSSMTLFNLKLENASLESAVRKLITAAQNKLQTTVCFINAHSVNCSESSPAFTRVLNRADIRFADGSGIAAAAKIAGQTLRDNVNGTDMLPLLAEEAARKGLSLYLYGGRPGVAERAGAALLSRYPELKIAGYDHGYYRPGSDDETLAIDRINASQPDILLIALGVPQQDIWLATNRDRLNASVRMGVGGLFDFFAGNVSRAPLFLRRFGMEWIWRLANEPLRLGRRYINGNLVFLRYALRRRIWGHEVDRSTPNHRIRYIHRKLLGSRAWRREFARRCLDIAISSTALIVACPIMLAVAVAIRLDSPGGALFRQTRIGVRGKPFTMYKFRSMKTGAEAFHEALQGEVKGSRDIRFKSAKDPRVTRIGRFIRKTSLDELPQLINVLKGDMSIVGPRPALTCEVARYSLEQRERLVVKPGITCTWQISGRADIDFVEQVALDRRYARERSISNDIAIMVKTVPAILRARGAY